MMQSLRQWAKTLKRQTYVLYLAYKDPRTPWYARVFTACVVAYAFSPIDLIPDFVPVLGYLDDLILVPLGVAIAIKLIPANVLNDCQQEAQRLIEQGKPISRVGAIVILTIWILAFIITVLAIWQLLQK
jgi:uncharacterized membrane protein YkvA (DUF1232 family)